jgi:hypothetical protein
MLYCVRFRAGSGCRRRWRRRLPTAPRTPPAAGGLPPWQRRGFGAHNAGLPCSVTFVGIREYPSLQMSMPRPALTPGPCRPPGRAGPGRAGLRGVLAPGRAGRGAVLAPGAVLGSGHAGPRAVLAPGPCWARGRAGLRAVLAPGRAGLRAVLPPGVLAPGPCCPPGCAGLRGRASPGPCWPPAVRPSCRTSHMWYFAHFPGRHSGHIVSEMGQEVREDAAGLRTGVFRQWLRGARRTMTGRADAALPYDALLRIGNDSFA